MKIGIKYCGGCNPRYNRKDFLEKLKRDLQDMPCLEFTTDRKSANVILELSGCSNACVSQENDTIIPVIHITNHSNYDEILARIRRKVTTHRTQNAEKAMNTF